MRSRKGGHRQTRGRVRSSQAYRTVANAVLAVRRTRLGVAGGCKRLARVVGGSASASAADAFVDCCVLALMSRHWKVPIGVAALHESWSHGSHSADDALSA